MEEQKDLAKRIRQALPTMSKSHKRIAEFICTNYDKAAYMTAAQMMEAVNISESTVVRFAYGLGFDGYPQLQKALQETVRNKLTMLQRMEMTSELAPAEVLRTVFKADISNLRSTLEELDPACFEQVVGEVCSARRVYIMGARSSAPLAQFMGYYLNFVLSNVTVVTSGVNDLLEQLMHIGTGDVLVAVSFPRYSKRAVEAVRYAKERGAVIVAITDGAASPLAEFSSYLLPAHSSLATFVDSLVAAFSIANALIAAVSMHKQHETSNSFQALERMWDRQDVYLEKTNDGL